MTFEDLVICMTIASVLWWAGCAVYIGIKTDFRITAHELFVHSLLLCLLIWEGYLPKYSPYWREEWKEKEGKK